MKLYMTPMKISILGIENLLIGQHFKHIPVSIFEKKFTHDLKFWILDFFMLFLRTVLGSQYAEFSNLIFWLGLLLG